MNMQAFYRRLYVKPSKAHHRRLCFPYPSDDSRGDYRVLGMPAALHALSQSMRSTDTEVVILNSFNEMYLTTAFGQFLDVQTPSTEPGYWLVTKTKSSPFFGAALQLGAMAGGASPKVAEQLKELGFLYGEMIQIHDDMHDSMETPANPDWVQGHSPLPILFATLVDHPDRERFVNLKQQVHSPDALEEAQEVLIHCGAISYCADQLIERHQNAIEILKHIPLVNHEPISALFDEILAPVDNLLNTFEL